MTPAKIYRTHRNEMLAYVYSMCSNKSDAEDILHDGFIIVFRKLHQYRGEGSFEGWLKTIFRNACNDHYRKRRLELIEEIPDVATYPTFLHDIYAKEIMESIMEIKMERRVKKIFLLRLEGYSHSDIGELLSIVECTSRAQYVRAKNILKKNVVL